MKRQLRRILSNRIRYVCAGAGVAVLLSAIIVSDLILIAIGFLLILPAIWSVCQDWDFYDNCVDQVEDSKLRPMR